MLYTFAQSSGQHFRIWIFNWGVCYELRMKRSDLDRFMIQIIVYWLVLWGFLCEDSLSRLSTQFFVSTWLTYGFYGIEKLNVYQFSPTFKKKPEFWYINIIFKLLYYFPSIQRVWTEVCIHRCFLYPLTDSFKFVVNISLPIINI